MNLHRWRILALTALLTALATYAITRCDDRVLRKAGVGWTR